MDATIAPASGLADRVGFYACLAAPEALGALTSGQVAGCEAILAACVGWPASWTAYALATAYHETAHTLKPVRERGSGDRDHDGRDDYLAKYDSGPLAAQLGNTPQADGDGVRYAGRGYVQLTGHANYLKAGQKLGVDLVGQPDLALDPAVAAKVMRFGMEAGWFTGKRLADYLPPGWNAGAVQFAQARRIINGQDCASLIAGYASKFQAALAAGLWRP